MILIFDWGDTVMRDFPGKPGAMADWDIVEYIPGIEKALQQLSKDHFCSIATNAGVSDTALMKKALERLGADQYFKFFTSSKDLSSEKPNPLFFEKIAAILGVDIKECVHIGNIYEKYITGAKAAGMRTVFFNEKKLDGEFRAADRIINHMDQLVDALKEIQASIRYTLEICCDSLQSAVLADMNGADRIELCAGLSEGGVTPSIGTIIAVMNAVRIPVNVLIRPRPGNFCYDESEFKSMIRDIAFCKKAGVNGIVCGALLENKELDIAQCVRIRDAIGSMDSTFHRAFDVADNPEHMLEQIIALRFDRILTSGQMQSALAGIENIRNYVTLANGRISIMPGAGIDENNILDLARISGAREFHMSLRSTRGNEAIMESKGVHFGMAELSGERIKKVRSLMNQMV